MLTISVITTGFAQFQRGLFLSASIANAQPTINVNSELNIFYVEGNLFVRVRADGTRTTFGESAVDGLVLSGPKDLAIDSQDNLYVADFGNSRILKFNKDGANAKVLGKDPGGLVGGVTRICIGRDGFLYAVNASKIMKFSTEGAFKQSWNLPQNDYPGPIVADASGNVYLLGLSSAKIYKLNTVSGIYQSWGGVGNGNGYFTAPSDLAINAYNEVFVADLWRNEVQKFTSDGKFVSSFGTQTSGIGALASPTGITIAPNGDAYVSEYNQSLLKIFAIMTILSVQPTKVKVGETVTITGNNFAFGGAAVQIATVGGVNCQLTENIDGKIAFVVAPGAKTGKISLGRSGIAVDWPDEVIVLPLAIKSIVPRASFIGETVTIRGSGFSSIPANNTVKFNGLLAEVKECSATWIKVTVPASTQKGKVSVAVQDEIAISDTEFEVAEVVTEYPGYFSVGDAGAAVVVTVDNISNVKEISFYARGITSELSVVQTEVVPFTGANAVDFVIDKKYFTDKVGLESWFKVTSKTDVVKISEPKNIYLQYTAANSQSIPDLQFGKKKKNYQIIAIPLDLKPSAIGNVFDEMGSSDEVKWRLLGLTMVGLEEPGRIDIGKGYWFISRDKKEISPGSGSTPKVTRDSPFIVTLGSGWNIIGNPYDFTISWSDVIKHNGSPEWLGGLIQFKSGGVRDNILPRFRGAYVKNSATTALQVEIPPIPVGTTGRQKQDKKPIDSKSWTIDLALEDSELRSEISGIGMNPNASDLLDKLDETNLPFLDDMSGYVLKMRPLENGEYLTKDIVATQNDYTWNASMRSEESTTISWDNSYFGDNQKQLIIEDSESVELVDMRLTNHYVVTPGEHLLSFHYGDTEYINRKVLKERPAIGSVHPNPINQQDKQIRIGANLPSGSYNIKFDLYDATGKGLVKSGSTSHQPGRYVVEWSADFSSIKSGMYLLKVEAYGAAGRLTEYRKVFFD